MYSDNDIIHYLSVGPIDTIGLYTGIYLKKKCASVGRPDIRYTVHDLPFINAG